MEKTKNALVMGKGVPVISGAPPPCERGDGEHHLAMVEGQLKDRSILDCAIQPSDVLGIGLIDVVTTDIGVFRGEIGRRDGCFHFPLAKIPKPRIERDHVVQGRGPRAGQTENHERSGHRISRFVRVTGVPIFDSESPAETRDEKRLDPVERLAVLTDIAFQCLDQAGQAVLPVTRSELGQPGVLMGTFDEPVNDDAHGAPLWPVLKDSACLIPTASLVDRLGGESGGGTVSLDLSGGMEPSVDEIQRDLPDLPAAREGVSLWMWDDNVGWGLPRMGVEALRTGNGTSHSVMLSLALTRRACLHDSHQRRTNARPQSAWPSPRARSRSVAI